MTEQSTTSRTPYLPQPWVDRIFSHMACMYGKKFAETWAGQDADTLKAFWAAKLAGFSDHPQAIKSALDALDERPFPPTLPEFMSLCRDALRRSPAGPALPPPQIDKAVARERLAQLKSRMRRATA